MLTDTGYFGLLIITTHWNKRSITTKAEPMHVAKDTQKGEDWGNK